MGSCLATSLTAIGVVFCLVYGVFLLLKMESGELDTYSSYNIKGTQTSAGYNLDTFNFLPFIEITFLRNPFLDNDEIAN